MERRYANEQGPGRAGAGQREDIMEEGSRLCIVLKQLIQNNDYLVENYRKWARVAATGGLDSVSRDIEEAGQLIQIATRKLRGALSSIESL